MLSLLRARASLSAALLVTLLAACSWGRDEPSAQEVENQSDTAVFELMSLTIQAIGASDFKAQAYWRSCMPGTSKKYHGDVLFRAPKGDVARQLEAVRAAFTGAGFTEIARVKGHVSVEREGLAVDLQKRRIGPDPHLWLLTYNSSCAVYRGADGERVNSNERRNVRVPTD